jgi:L-asparaginase II
LPLVVSGAADRFALSDAELALACASHMGAPLHAETALSMLAKAGRPATCLECGTHWPTSSNAARALAASGGQPGPQHNACSGKHAGFICTALAEGRDPAGYVAPDHPTMKAVTACVSAITGIALSRQSPAVDGCSIPTFMIPLTALAAGFARFGSGLGVSREVAAACARLRQAVAGNPVMVAGEGRFDTVVMQALGEAAFVKLGAEGVYCAALPSLGLGIALKCDDGSPRAAEVAMAGLLLRHLGPHPVLERLAAPVLRNWNGLEIGGVRTTL